MSAAETSVYQSVCLCLSVCVGSGQLHARRNGRRTRQRFSAAQSPLDVGQLLQVFIHDVVVD